jgi:hypothetical protein
LGRGFVHQFIGIVDHVKETAGNADGPPAVEVGHEPPVKVVVTDFQQVENIPVDPHGKFREKLYCTFGKYTIIIMTGQGALKPARGDYEIRNHDRPDVRGGGDGFWGGPGGFFL